MTHKYNLLPLAVERAHYWHSGQTRNYNGLPYIVHPLAVLELVRCVTDHEPTLCIAVLHDVMEDQGITKKQLVDIFGNEIADGVDWLSVKTTKADGNRATRKRIDRERLSNAPSGVQTVKVADIIHNCSAILDESPSFARTYVPEKRLQLDVLTKADEFLWQMADTELRHLEDCLRQMEQ